MLKSWLTGIFVFAVVAAVLISPPAEAQTSPYYFVSSCSNVNPQQCPAGPSPVWFGPYPTEEACWADYDALFYGSYFNTYPRSLSGCFQY